MTCLSGVGGCYEKYFGSFQKKTQHKNDKALFKTALCTPFIGVFFLSLRIRSINSLDATGSPHRIQNLQLMNQFLLCGTVSGIITATTIIAISLGFFSGLTVPLVVMELFGPLVTLVATPFMAKVTLLSISILSCLYIYKMYNTSSEINNIYKQQRNA